jgi:hypothetical protein
MTCISTASLSFSAASGSAIMKTDLARETDKKKETKKKIAKTTEEKYQDQGEEEEWSGEERRK